SRDIASIIKETESLRKDLDIKEAVLIGQDTTSFGLDRGKKSELPRLLKELSGIMEGRWIRLLYTHPARFTDELIETIAALDNVCGYVDLPVQHINSRILEKMNRAALKEEIIGLIGRIRSGIKDVTLRTSVIVGFPGETEEEFGELMDFLEKTKFDRLGAFIYSREESTPAYVLEGQVPEDIKKRRLDDVMQLQQEISSAKNAEMIGKTIRVLIDEKEGTQTDLFTARGEMDAPEVDGSVFIKGKGLKAGEFARVKITGAMEYDLTGDAV
ncbi:MAG: MiaB/RimO family radical SAM methylthiotransferase, partial [Candidatus Omnitrophica bacterium]|nr:MiaB/RimO family radical SAM methylthiotransferase [Candidatus Omnitrophota bacterium]